MQKLKYLQTSEIIFYCYRFHPGNQQTSIPGIITCPFSRWAHNSWSQTLFPSLSRNSILRVFFPGCIWMADTVGSERENRGNGFPLRVAVTLPPSGTSSSSPSTFKAGASIDTRPSFSSMCSSPLWTFSLVSVVPSVSITAPLHSGILFPPSFTFFI